MAHDHSGMSDSIRLRLFDKDGKLKQEHISQGRAAAPQEQRRKDDRDEADKRTTED